MQEIQAAKHAHEPVESFKVIVIQVSSRQPRPILRTPSHAVHDGNDDRAHIVTHRQRSPRERRSQRPHRRRSFGEEELQQSGQGEKVGGPEEKILNRDPKESDRQLSRRVHQPRVGSDSLPLYLHQRRHGHGGDGEEETDPDALEMRYSHLGFGESASEGDDEVVVNWGYDEDEKDWENRKRSRRDVQGAELGVHGSGLLD